jgi:hypothetical protein
VHAPEELQPFLDQLSLTGPVEPFLVFADWLQGRGDPWGELIAMQCHTEMLGAVDDAKRRELRLVGYGLLAKLADRLCPHDPLVGIAWQRGFVGTIAFSDSHGPDWLGGELARLFASPVTSLCAELTFGGAQIGDDDVRALLRVKPHLDRIRRLDLEGNWFSQATISALERAFPNARLGKQRNEVPDEREGAVSDRGVLIRSWGGPGSDE